MPSSSPIPPAVAGAVAYFGVKVPQNGRVTEARAREVIERYLYHPAEVTSVVADYSEGGLDDVVYMVTVRMEEYRHENALSYLIGRVGHQRDRLASGLHPTTEPVFLAPVED